MGNSSDSATRVTLLGRLVKDPTNQAAWSEFVDRYGPKIQAWCQEWHLQQADAQDVTQDVLVKLAEKLRDFRYDPSGSFRAWLKTVTHHAWQDFRDSRERAGLGSGDSRVWEILQAVAAPDDLVQRLEKEFDREILEEAMVRVRLRVAPQTWEAFRLLALENLPGTQVAAQLHMKVATVFVARSKVQKMIRQEISKLEQVS
ncbi:MAG TPA: sigma-70 family RNA polymerase sigma factor [Gemmataceae bacterium]|nr:sigma-70 family RNA polymerase sigma factor [Gemmataceae bacterium]